MECRIVVFEEKRKKKVDQRRWGFFFFSFFLSFLFFFFFLFPLKHWSSPTFAEARFHSGTSPRHVELVEACGCIRMGKKW